VAHLRSGDRRSVSRVQSREADDPDGRYRARAAGRRVIGGDTMKGIPWKTALNIVIVGAAAFAAIDVFSGAYSKDKLIAAGWTPK